MAELDHIRSSLDNIAQDHFFDDSSTEVVERWELESIGFEAVEPVLAFMEEHPYVDFGSPGALTHFIEKFHRRGYDEALLSSVKRRPTPHTVWLLNRLINGEHDESVRLAQISLMREAAANQSASLETRSTAAGFLMRLGG